MKTRGFTLLEVIIVMVLISLTVSIVIPNIGRTYEKVKFIDKTKRAVDLIQKIKFNSYFYQKRTVISEDGGQLIVTGMELSEEDIPDIRFVISEGIVFTPNGTSSGGLIEMYYEDTLHSVIYIKKFSGDIELRRAE